MADLENEFDNEINLDDAFDSEESIQAPMGISEGEELEPASYLNTELPEEQGGALDAFVQHAAPSATLGISDVVAGGAGALGHAYGNVKEKGELPSKEELLETYYEAKGNTVDRRDKAMEEHPVASVSGMVGGGFLTPIPGAAMAKLGKVGKTISKAMPSMKGAGKISKAGQLAEKAKLVGDISRYKTLKAMQKGAATKLALREGAKAGAISGMTLGPSKLLEGDVDGFISDTLEGGVAGGTLGYGFTKGTQVAGNLIKKVPGVRNAIDSFKFGSRGIDLDETEVNNEINKTARKYIKDFNGRLDSLKIDKQKVLDQIDELGVTINTKSDLVKARQIVKGIDSDAERKRAQQFLDVLDDYLGEGKAYKKAKESLEKKIAKARFVDPVAEARIKQQKIDLKEAIETQKVPVSSDDIGVVSSKDILPGGPEVKANVKHNIMEEMTPEGAVQTHKFSSQDIPEFKPSNIQRTVEPGSNREVAFFKDMGKGKVHAVIGEEAKALDAEKLTTGQANKLKGLLNNYSTLAKKESLPQEVRHAATEAAKKINDKINGAADKIKAPISDINRKITNLLTAKDRTGAGRDITGTDKDNSIKAMAKFVSGVGDKNPTSDKNLVIQRLRKVDPKMAEEISAELDDLRRMYELTKPTEAISAQGGKMAAIMGTVSGIWNKAFNTLGQASSAPFRAVKKGAGASKRFLANKTLDFVEASPAQMQGLISKISESGNKGYTAFQAPLKRAMESKPRTKQAILYGLYQQPAFREMVEAIHTEEPSEE